jgi:hypothetical protein
MYRAHVGLFVCFFFLFHFWNLVVVFCEINRQSDNLMMTPLLASCSCDECERSFSRCGREGVVG